MPPEWPTPVKEWMCPRCGIEGDDMKTADPTRCRQCCAADASMELLQSLRECLDIVRLQNGNLYDDINEIQERAEAAIDKAEGRR